MKKEKIEYPPHGTDVNGVALAVGQTICFHSGGGSLRLGKIVKFGKLQLYKPSTWYKMINIFVQPINKEKTPYLENVKKGNNVLVLDQLLSTYL